MEKSVVLFELELWFTKQKENVTQVWMNGLIQVHNLNSREHCSWKKKINQKMYLLFCKGTFGFLATEKNVFFLLH